MLLVKHQHKLKEDAAEIARLALLKVTNPKEYKKGEEASAT
jgi:hypothetical protein